MLNTLNAKYKGMLTKDCLAVALLLLSGMVGLFVLFQTCSFHDALWTYGYMRSFLLDHDVSFFNEFMLSNSYFMYVPHPHEPVFYCGAGLLMAPFFLVGHVLAGIGTQWHGVFMDGYSWPYTLLTSLSGVVAGMVALVLIYHLCRKYFDTGPSLIGVMLVFWAGNMVFYTFVWPLYSHAFSVLLVTIFLLCWLLADREDRLSVWILAGGVLGFACWIRPQNVLFASLPLISMVGMLRRKRTCFKQVLLRGCVFGMAWLVCFSPQMVLWLKTEGRPVVDAYAHIGDDFFWFSPRFDYLLFSSNKGFFIWTPIFVLLIPGFFALLRVAGRVAWMLLLAFVLQAYLVASYEFPEGGAGYGSRYLINCTPFFALCLVALIQSMRLRGRVLLGCVGLFLVYCNVGLMIAYQLEMLPHNKYTPHYAELVGNACMYGPMAIGQYVFSTGINENVFARVIVSALRCDQFRLAVTWLGVFVTCGVAVVGFSLAACKLKGIVSRYTRSFLGMGLFFFVLIDVFFFLLVVGPVYQNVWPLLQVKYDRQEAPPALNIREFSLSPERPSQEIAVNYGKSVNLVDLTSTLTMGRGIRNGEVLAILQVIGANGQCEEFPIVNGLNTAEYGASREGWEEDAIVPKSVVHHWLSRDGDHYYYGNGYHTRYVLSDPICIKDMRFVYVAPYGRLIVNGVVLSQCKREEGQ